MYQGTRDVSTSKGGNELKRIVVQTKPIINMLAKAQKYIYEFT